MKMSTTRIDGVVEVLAHDDHDARGSELSSALARLSAARSQRGPVDMLDPLQLAPRMYDGEASLAPTRDCRRRLFRFSERARNATT